MCASTIPAAASANQPHDDARAPVDRQQTGDARPRPASSAAPRPGSDTAISTPDRGARAAGSSSRARTANCEKGHWAVALFADCAAEVSAMAPKPRRPRETTPRPAEHRTRRREEVRGVTMTTTDDRTGPGAAALVDRRRGPPLHRRRGYEHRQGLARGRAAGTGSTATASRAPRSPRTAPPPPTRSPNTTGRSRRRPCRPRPCAACSSAEPPPGARRATAFRSVRQRYVSAPHDERRHALARQLTRTLGSRRCPRRPGSAGGHRALFPCGTVAVVVAYGAIRLWVHVGSTVHAPRRPRPHRDRRAAGVVPRQRARRLLAVRLAPPRSRALLCPRTVVRAVGRELTQPVPRRLAHQRSSGARSQCGSCGRGMPASS